MGVTSIPCAPSSLSFPIISQNRFWSSTVCTEHQSLSASGIIVGLFRPGNTLTISCTRSLGAFMLTYFLSSAFLTASNLKSISLRISFLSSLICLLPMSTASLRVTTSTSLRLLLTNVEPLLTMSKIPSAKPIPGAISTLPVIMCISALKLSQYIRI